MRDSSWGIAVMGDEVSTSDVSKLIATETASRGMFTDVQVSLKSYFIAKIIANRPSPYTYIPRPAVSCSCSKPMAVHLCCICGRQNAQQVRFRSVCSIAVMLRSIRYTTTQNVRLQPACTV